MNKITDVLSQILSYKSNKSTLGFTQLDNHFPGVDGLVFYYFDEKLLPAVIKHINVSEVNNYNDLGQTDAYWVDYTESFRDKDWKRLIYSLSINQCSAIVLVPVSKSSKLRNQDKIMQHPMELTQFCSFIGEFLNENLELIVLKNRFSHKGKIQLNTNQLNLMTLIQYKPKKFNIITGQAAGYKTAVMNTIIKQYLNEGRKICYLGSPASLSRLLLDLTEHKTKEVNLDLLNGLIEKYNKQLFFEVDFAKVDKDVIVFSDMNIEERYNLFVHLPNSEIWQTCDQNRLGEFDYYKAEQTLQKNGESNFININRNDSKMILETESESKGFYFKDGLVDLDVFINLNNYTSLFGLSMQIQRLNAQIETLSANIHINKSKIETVMQTKEDLLTQKQNIIKNRGQK